MNNVMAVASITTENLNPTSGVATAGSTIAIATNGLSSVRMQVKGTYTGVLTPQCTVNGTDWITMAGAGVLYRASSGAISTTVGSGVQDIFSIGVAGASQFRLTALGAITGTAVVTLNVTEGGSGGDGGGGGEITSSQIVAAIQAATLPVEFDSNGALNSGYDGAAFTPAGVTSAAVIFTQDMTGYEGIGIQVIDAGTSCTITYETSQDNTNWVSTTGMQTVAANTGIPAPTSTTAVGTVFQKKLTFFRARVSTYGSGTVTVVYGLHKTAPQYWTGQVSGQANSAATISGNPVRIGTEGRTSNILVTSGQTANAVATLNGAVVIQPYSIPELAWTYAAAAGGIVNSTTAVTIKAAGAAGVRNYLTGMQISVIGTVAAGSEIAIRDGAAGTVVWRGSLPITAVHGPTSLRFDPPIKGTAATLMEVVTLSAMGASSAVYVSAQGFQAA